MSAMAILSVCPSRATSIASTFLSSMDTLEHLRPSARASLERHGNSCSSFVRLDKLIDQKDGTPAPRAGVQPLVAAALHTSGGSVDRNDAAPTGPLILPNPQISLEEAVRLQMEALACNDEPRPDHGLEVMYYFANLDGTDTGGSLPQYFGFPSDLYHFGHFALKVKTRCPELINHTGYNVVKVEEDKEAEQGGSVQVTVRARRGHDDSSSWVFTMSKRVRGKQLPCWLTTSLTRASS